MTEPTNSSSSNSEDSREFFEQQRRDRDAFSGDSVRIVCGSQKRTWQLDENRELSLPMDEGRRIEVTRRV